MRGKGYYARDMDDLRSAVRRSMTAVAPGNGWAMSACRMEKIVQTGKANGKAARVIEAHGLALMPGIVDVHTHYDAQATWDRTLSPSPALGVTTPR